MPDTPAVQPSSPSAVAEHPRKARAFDPRKPGPGAIDRAKEYLKEVPEIHARLKKFIFEQEHHLATAKSGLAEFEVLTARVKALVDGWEKAATPAQHKAPAIAAPVSAAPVPGGAPPPVAMPKQDDHAAGT